MIDEDGDNRSYERRKFKAAPSAKRLPPTDDAGDRRSHGLDPNSLEYPDAVVGQNDGRNQTGAGQCSSQCNPDRSGGGTVPVYSNNNGAHRRDDLIRIADLFVKMIAIVEPCVTPATRLPPEGLSSLLRQCEAISASDTKDPVPLLIAMPGLPMLDAGWWQGAAGWKVVRLTTAQLDGSRGIAGGQLNALHDSRARFGQQPLAIASADEVPAQLSDTLRPLALLACHPWSAFVASGSGQLESFSAPLLDLLDRHPNLPLYQVSTKDLADPLACCNRLLRLVEGDLQIDPSDYKGVISVVPNDYRGGAPKYETLCRRLGHDPERAPQKNILRASNRSLSINNAKALLPENGAPVAAVSWFLDRLSTLPAGAAMVTRMRLLIPTLDACLTAPAFPEAIDQAAGQLHPNEVALLRLLAGAHFQRYEDPLQSMSFIAEALEEVPSDLPVLHQAAALLYLELNHPLQALEALAGPLSTPGVMGKSAALTLRKAMHGDAPSDAGQHGQALLLAALTQDPPVSTPEGRRRTMIEIGTTREMVPGQGSTRQLALLCAKLGIDFVTVDMDPANSRRAARMFRRLELPFAAVTDKGEDFLAKFDGVIDYAFLDAYDFDHGKHSEMRQARYEQLLGTRINDDDCHRMHLDCVRTLRDKLAPDGLICFDDTWTDEAGDWAAKGKTAMPFLLDNGFALVEARNCAALLRRA